MSLAATTTLVLLGCVAATAVASVFRWSPPLRVSVGVAFGLRVVIAVLARGHTPYDVRNLFHTTAVLVSRGQDPLSKMPRYQWNFLPVMPYVWSVLLHLHLPWETTDKIVTVAADCVNTVLVAALATTRKRLRALQYALSPCALMIVSWHGQVEPIALTAALLAFIALRNRKNVVAGALVGVGVAIKTWPILFTLAVLRWTNRRAWPAVIAGVIAVPLAVFLTMPLVIDASLGKDARIIAGYRSAVGIWGWSGIVRMVFGRDDTGYTGTVQSLEQHISTVILLVAIPIVLWAWRRAEPGVFMLAVLLIFLGTTAGFGTQYLMWPLPFAIAFSTRRTWLYIWPAAAYAAAFYIHRGTSDALTLYSLPVIVGVFAALPLDQRDRRWISPDVDARAAERAT